MTRIEWWSEPALTALLARRIDRGSGSEVWEVVLPDASLAVLLGRDDTTRARSSTGTGRAAVYKCLDTGLPDTAGFQALLAAAHEGTTDAVFGRAGDAPARLRREAGHLLLLRDVARDTGAVPVLLASLVDDAGAAYVPGGILMERTGDTSVAELVWGDFVPDADDLRRYQLRQWEVAHLLHSRGVVHRDIHPGNQRLKLDGDGRPLWETLSFVDLGEATSLAVPLRDAWGRAIRSHPEAPAPYRAPDFDADYPTLAEKCTLDYYAMGQCIRAVALGDVHLTNAGATVAHPVFDACPDLAAVVASLTRPWASERDRKEIESLLGAVRDNVDVPDRPAHHEAPKGARPEEEPPLDRATPVPDVEEHDVEMTDLRALVSALQTENGELRASLAAGTQEQTNAAAAQIAELRARTEAEQRRFQAETSQRRAEERAEVLEQALVQAQADLERQETACRAAEEELARERAKSARLDADTSRVQREVAEARAKVLEERTAALEEQVSMLITELDAAERRQEETRRAQAAATGRAQAAERRVAAGDAERARLIVRVRAEAQQNLDYADALRNSAEHLLEAHTVIEGLRAMADREQAEFDQMHRLQEVVELLTADRDSLERMVDDLTTTLDRVYELNEQDETVTNEQALGDAHRQAG